MECNCFDLCLRHEALQVLHLEVSLIAVSTRSWSDKIVVLLDTHFDPDGRDSELLEAGAVDIFDVSLCPHSRGVQANHRAILAVVTACVAPM